jgi:hypothetical protein
MELSKSAETIPQAQSRPDVPVDNGAIIVAQNNVIVEPVAAVVADSSFQPGQLVDLRNTLYNPQPREAIVYGRIEVEDFDEEMYFVESPEGDAMVTKVDQMTLSKKPPQDFNVVPYSTSNYDLEDDVRYCVLYPQEQFVSRIVDPLQRIQIGMHCYVLVLQVTHDERDFEDLCLVRPRRLNTINLPAPIKAGAPIYVKEEEEEEDFDWLWHATALKCANGYVKVRYTNIAKAKEYGLPTSVPVASVFARNE